MGTASSKKFLKQVGGQITEEAALLTSAGSADANRIPALNASGYLDPTIVNGTQTSAGTADAGKVVQLGADGLISETMLPDAPELATVLASEALTAGNLINIYNNAGTANMRKADAASNKPAHGFVKASVASGTAGVVYTEGRITGLSGKTPGQQWLGASGASTNTPPTASGSIVQAVGVSPSATEILFESSLAILLA